MVVLLIQYQYRYFRRTWPLISANAASVVCEEVGALDLVLQAIQGAVPLTVYWEINGVPQQMHKLMH